MVVNERVVPPSTRSSANLGSSFSDMSQADEDDCYDISQPKLHHGYHGNIATLSNNGNVAHTDDTGEANEQGTSTVPKLLRPAADQYYCPKTSKADKIIDVLYLGDRQSAANKEWLSEHGITHIINMAAITCNCFYPGVFKYLSIPIHDTVTQDISQFFTACTKFINKAIRQDGKVLVHCEAGKSRSATIIMQYLISQEGLTLKESYKLVKRNRIIVMPNISFFAQLRKFEKELTGEESLALDVPHYVMYNFKLEKKYVREQRVKRMMGRMLPFSFRNP